MYNPFDSLEEDDDPSWPTSNVPRQRSTGPAGINPSSLQFSGKSRPVFGNQYNSVLSPNKLSGFSQNAGNSSNMELRFEQMSAEGQGRFSKDVDEQSGKLYGGFMQDEWSTGSCGDLLHDQQYSDKTRTGLLNSDIAAGCVVSSGCHTAFNEARTVSRPLFPILMTSSQSSGFRSCQLANLSRPSAPIIRPFARSTQVAPTLTSEGGTPHRPTQPVFGLNQLSSGVGLTGTRFGVQNSQSNLMGSYLRGSNMTGVNRPGSNVAEANVIGLNMPRANVQGQNMSTFNVSESKMPDLNLPVSTVSGLTRHGVNVLGSNVPGANLPRSNIPGSNMVGSNMSGTNMPGSNMFGSNIQQSNLPVPNRPVLSTAINSPGLTILKSNMPGTNVPGTHMSRPNMLGSNLPGSNMPGSNMPGSNIAGSALSGPTIPKPQAPGWYMQGSNTLNTSPRSGTTQRFDNSLFGRHGVTSPSSIMPFQSMPQRQPFSTTVVTGTIQPNLMSFNTRPLQESLEKTFQPSAPMLHPPVPPVPPKMMYFPMLTSSFGAVRPKQIDVQQGNMGVNDGKELSEPTKAASSESEISLANESINKTVVSDSTASLAIITDSSSGGASSLTTELSSSPLKAPFGSDKSGMLPADCADEVKESVSRTGLQESSDSNVSKQAVEATSIVSSLSASAESSSADKSPRFTRGGFVEVSIVQGSGKASPITAYIEPETGNSKQDNASILPGSDFAKIGLSSSSKACADVLPLNVLEDIPLPTDVLLDKIPEPVSSVSKEGVKSKQDSESLRSMYLGPSVEFLVDLTNPDDVSQQSSDKDDDDSDDDDKSDDDVVEHDKSEDEDDKVCEDNGAKVVESESLQVEHDVETKESEEKEQPKEDDGENLASSDDDDDAEQPEKVDVITAVGTEKSDASKKPKIFYECRSVATDKLDEGGLGGVVERTGWSRVDVVKEISKEQEKAVRLKFDRLKSIRKTIADETRSEEQRIKMWPARVPIGDLTGKTAEYLTRVVAENLTSKATELTKSTGDRLEKQVVNKEKQNDDEGKGKSGVSLMAGGSLSSKTSDDYLNNKEPIGGFGLFGLPRVINMLKLDAKKPSLGNDMAGHDGEKEMVNESSFSESGINLNLQKEVGKESSDHQKKGEVEASGKSMEESRDKEVNSDADSLLRDVNKKRLPSDESRQTKRRDKYDDWDNVNRSGDKHRSSSRKSKNVPDVSPRQGDREHKRRSESREDRGADRRGSGDKGKRSGSGREKRHRSDRWSHTPDRRRRISPDLDYKGRYEYRKNNIRADENWKHRERSRSETPMDMMRDRSGSKHRRNRRGSPRHRRAQSHESVCQDFEEIMERGHQRNLNKNMDEFFEENEYGEISKRLRSYKERSRNVEVGDKRVSGREVRSPEFRKPSRKVKNDGRERQSHRSSEKRLSDLSHSIDAVDPLDAVRQDQTVSLASTEAYEHDAETFNLIQSTNRDESDHAQLHSELELTHSSKNERPEFESDEMIGSREMIEQDEDNILELNLRGSLFSRNYKTDEGFLGKHGENQQQGLVGEKMRDESRDECQVTNAEMLVLDEAIDSRPNEDGRERTAAGGKDGGESGIGKYFAEDLAVPVKLSSKEDEYTKQFSADQRDSGKRKKKSSKKQLSGRHEARPESNEVFFDEQGSSQNRERAGEAPSGEQCDSSKNKEGFDEEPSENRRDSRKNKTKSKEQPGFNENRGGFDEQVSNERHHSGRNREEYMDQVADEQLDLNCTKDRSGDQVLTTKQHKNRNRSSLRHDSSKNRHRSDELSVEQHDSYDDLIRVDKHVSRKRTDSSSRNAARSLSEEYLDTDRKKKTKKRKYDENALVKNGDGSRMKEKKKQDNNDSHLKGDNSKNKQKTTHAGHSGEKEVHRKGETEKMNRDRDRKQNDKEKQTRHRTGNKYMVEDNVQREEECIRRVYVKPMERERYEHERLRKSRSQSKDGPRRHDSAKQKKKSSHDRHGRNADLSPRSKCERSVEENHQRRHSSNRSKSTELRSVNKIAKRKKTPSDRHDSVDLARRLNSPQPECERIHYVGLKKKKKKTLHVVEPIDLEAITETMRRVDRNNSRAEWDRAGSEEQRRITLGDRGVNQKNLVDRPEVRVHSPVPGHGMVEKERTPEDVVWIDDAWDCRKQSLIEWQEKKSTLLGACLSTRKELENEYDRKRAERRKLKRKKRKEECASKRVERQVNVAEPVEGEELVWISGDEQDGFSMMRDILIANSVSDVDMERAQLGKRKKVHGKKEKKVSKEKKKIKRSKGMKEGGESREEPERPLLDQSNRKSAEDFFRRPPEPSVRKSFGHSKEQVKESHAGAEKSKHGKNAGGNTRLRITKDFERDITSPQETEESDNDIMFPSSDELETDADEVLKVRETPNRVLVSMPNKAEKSHKSKKQHEERLRIVIQNTGVKRKKVADHIDKRSSNSDSQIYKDKDNCESDGSGRNQGDHACLSPKSIGLQTDDLDKSPDPDRCVSDENSLHFVQARVSGHLHARQRVTRAEVSAGTESSLLEECESGNYNSRFESDRFDVGVEAQGSESVTPSSSGKNVAAGLLAHSTPGNVMRGNTLPRSTVNSSGISSTGLYAGENLDENLYDPMCASQISDEEDTSGIPVSANQNSSTLVPLQMAANQDSPIEHYRTRGFGTNESGLIRNSGHQSSVQQIGNDASANAASSILRNSMMDKGSPVYVRGRRLVSPVYESDDSQFEGQIFSSTVRETDLSSQHRTDVNRPIVLAANDPIVAGQKNWSSTPVAIPEITALPVVVNPSGAPHISSLQVDTSAIKIPDNIPELLTSIKTLFPLGFGSTSSHSGMSTPNLSASSVPSGSGGVNSSNALVSPGQHSTPSLQNAPVLSPVKLCSQLNAGNLPGTAAVLPGTAGIQPTNLGILPGTVGMQPNLYNASEFNPDILATSIVASFLSNPFNSSIFTLAQNNTNPNPVIANQDLGVSSSTMQQLAEQLWKYMPPEVEKKASAHASAKLRSAERRRRHEAERARIKKLAEKSRQRHAERKKMSSWLEKSVQPVNTDIEIDLTEGMIKDPFENYSPGDEEIVLPQEAEVESPRSDEIASFSPPSPPPREVEEGWKGGSRRKAKESEAVTEAVRQEWKNRSASEIRSHVVEEVKQSLMPFFTKRRITKDEYKDILRKAVPKILKSKTKDFSKTRITIYVEAYVRKVKQMKKYLAKKAVWQQQIDLV